MVGLYEAKRYKLLRFLGLNIIDFNHEAEYNRF